MFWMALHLVAVLLSLTFFGILRTCLWLIPGIFHPFLFTISGGSLISFLAIAPLIAPFKDSFDFRDLEKEKWALIFFLSGVFTFILFYPCDTWVMPFGSLFPWILIQFSKALKMEIPLLFQFKKRWRFILVGIWLLFFTGKYLYVA